jgi:hypothetical protein
MNQKLQGFFNATQQQAAVYNAEEQERLEKRQGLDALGAETEAELGGILALLKSLPKRKDGKRFFVKFTDYPVVSDDPWGKNLRVCYAEGPYERSHRRTYHPEINIALFREQDGGVKASICQHSITDPESLRQGDDHYLSIDVAGWDGIRQQLGLGIGSFAPERLAEINAAAADQAEKPAPSAGITVFNKPLRLKTAPDASSGETAGRRVWKRISAKLHI